MLLTLVKPVSVLAVVLVGLIAGLLVGTAIEQKTLLVLDPAPWTIARHSTDAVFSRVLPGNFLAIRDRWLRFHVVRTVLGSVGFVFAVLGLGWREGCG